MIEYTEEEIADMEAIVMAHRAKKEAERVARQELVLKPMRDLVSSDDWKNVQAALTAFSRNESLNVNVSTHLTALVEIMPRFVASIPPAIIAPLLPAPEAPAEPDPAE